MGEWRAERRSNTSMGEWRAEEPVGQVERGSPTTPREWTKTGLAIREVSPLQPHGSLCVELPKQRYVLWREEDEP